MDKIVAQRVSNYNNQTTDFNRKINKSLEFSKILENVQKENGLKLSAHASERLKERNINLDENDMKILKTAVDSIRDKGGREALILYKNVAYVTSVKNNTVITAVDNRNLKDNIFTNIDSAVIL